MAESWIFIPMISVPIRHFDISENGSIYIFQENFHFAEKIEKELRIFHNFLYFFFRAFPSRLYYINILPKLTRSVLNFLNSFAIHFPVVSIFSLTCFFTCFDNLKSTYHSKTRKNIFYVRKMRRNIKQNSLRKTEEQQGSNRKMGGLTLIGEIGRLFWGFSR